MREGSNTAGLVMDDREAGIFRVHRSAFVDEEIFELERRLIFDRSWLFAAHASEISNPGDFITRKVAGRPLIVVRSDDGEIRGLLNTCRHRGNLVCREQKGAGAEVFRCFYHGWIFNTRGELKGIPGEAAYSDAFDRDALGLEPVPRMHIHRGCIFVSFDPDIESFESYMADALAVLDNTLDLGDMEFSEGQFQYSMRANWKLLVENSMDAYHAAYTHERFFTKFLPAVNLGDPLQLIPQTPRSLKNGHATTAYPSAGSGLSFSTPYLEKYGGEAFQRHRQGLVERYGPEKARMVENAGGNYLIFPNLVIVDGWRVFRTFYPTAPNYMEINGWACLPKEDEPELRKARLDWYLGFQGPGGFATPDDVEALEGCQMGFATHKEVEWSDISRGMKAPSSTGELQMRVFWREWAARMSGSPHAAEHSD